MNPLGAGAHKKRRPITEMYIKLLASDPEKLRRFCAKQIDKALEGDTVAAKDIIDRIEGKPLQSIDVDDQRTTDSRSRLEALFAGAIAADSEQTKSSRTQ